MYLEEKLRELKGKQRNVAKAIDNKPSYDEMMSLYRESVRLDIEIKQLQRDMVMSRVLQGLC